MGEFKVADIEKGKKDFTGVEVETVYSKVSETYAVYRTAERVVVQYSDDDKLAVEQRLALSPLNPTRGEINGLIDSWRESDRPEKQERAKLFDRRVADALIVALQGDPAHAQDLLTALKADVVEERTSVARTQYLVVAFASAAILVAVLTFVAVNWLSAYDSLITLVKAAAIGAGGALFSIALSIRDRSIFTDLQSRDNAVDAVLRVIIGAASAVILFSLLRAKFVSFGFGATTISDVSMTTADSIATAIVVAFAAGFSERLVGDLLRQSVLSKVEANPLAGADTAKRAGRPPPDANEQNPLGKPSAAPASNGTRAERGIDSPPEGDDADCCLAGKHLDVRDLTDDVELPEATGGVEKPIP